MYASEEVENCAEITMSCECESLAACVCGREGKEGWMVGGGGGVADCGVVLYFLLSVISIVITRGRPIWFVRLAQVCYRCLLRLLR